MFPYLFYDLLLTVPLGLIAVVLIYLSLQGIVTRKPYLFSSRLFTFLISLVFAGLIVARLSLQFSPFRSGFSLIAVIQVVLYFGVLYMAWRQPKGFFVLGASSDTFGKALIDALDELGVSYKESVSGYTLDDVDDILKVDILWDWMEERFAFKTAFAILWLVWQSAAP